METFAISLAMQWRLPKFGSFITRGFDEMLRGFYLQEIIFDFDVEGCLLSTKGLHSLWLTVAMTFLVVCDFCF